MSAFSTALVPIMVLIIVGFCLKRAKFLPEDAWAGMEKLTYFVLFPALLIRTFANQTLAGVPWQSMLIVVGGTLMTSAVLLILFYRIQSSVTDATFTSIFQGGVRFNTYISLAVAQGLYGIKGLELSSVAAGFMIVLINFLCISVFVVWGRASFKGVTSFFREILSNPLIIACVIGWFLSFSGIGLPGITENVFEIVGRAALPFGLLAVGAALKPEVLRGHVKPVAISSLVQFGLKPLITFLLIFSTGISGVAAGVLFIAFMTPTAPSGYILARQLGGDTESMASIITFQTLLAFLVMPFLAFLLLG